MAQPSTTLQLSQPISDPHGTFTYSPMERSLSTSLASPIEISQQLQRIDVLHQQLKAETVRAQEFLLKLRRGEAEAHTQSQLQAQAAQQGQQQRHQQHHQHEHDRQQRKSSAPTASTNGDHSHHHTSEGTASNESVCKCSCPHHPPLSPSSDAKMRKATGNNNTQMSLHSHVDESEVRDLEKRVRGLEGRVRGFEGLPPDREMALLEVERLRKELEGLARRREGLFEVVDKEIGGETASRKGAKNGHGTAKVTGGGKMASNGNAVGNGKR